MPARKRIPPLPFRNFFAHEELVEFIEALAASRPDLCRLGSLGRSREGREVYLLTITDFVSGSPDDRPGYLVHGNIHAGELSGTHTALYTARQFLVDDAGSDLLKRVVFYVVPRLNPDGAHFVATTSGRIRSRTDNSERVPNTLYQEDLDGDGLILNMRQEHPDGDVARDPKEPRLLIRRKAGSKGPFYRVLPEGTIHEWDGSDKIQIEGRGFDWNRNWSYDWRPEPEQSGVGDFPFSETEMRHMGEFMHSHPNLFGVLGYHTGPAAVLCPPSTGSENDLSEHDVRMTEDLARIGADHTGFPVIPVIKYHRARSRDINLRGHFHNFGYHHLGLYVFEFELGIMMNSAGISTQDQLGAESPEEGEAHMRKMLKWWDRQKPRPPLFRPWKRFDHPQLGEVEVGGLISRHVANRTLKDLAKTAKGTYQFTTDHANRHPQVALEDLDVCAVGGDIYRVRARVANRGELPTHVTDKGKGLSRLRPVRVEFHPAKGVELLSAEGHASLGHLAGVTGSRLLEWFVSAPGQDAELSEIRVLGGTGGNARKVIMKG